MYDRVMLATEEELQRLVLRELLQKHSQADFGVQPVASHSPAPQCSSEVGLEFKAIFIYTPFW